MIQDKFKDNHARKLWGCKYFLLQTSWDPYLSVSSRSYSCYSFSFQSAVSTLVYYSNIMLNYLPPSVCKTSGAYFLELLDANKPNSQCCYLFVKKKNFKMETRLVFETNKDHVINIKWEVEICTQLCDELVVAWGRGCECGLWCCVWLPLYFCNFRLHSRCGSSSGQESTFRQTCLNLNNSSRLYSVSSFYFYSSKSLNQSIQH